MKFYVSVWALAACLMFSLNAEAGNSGDMSVQWNRNLLQIVRTPGAQPSTIHATRNFAIMHIAMDEAVNAIKPTHTSYLSTPIASTKTASQIAAAASAAYNSLVVLYPAQKTLLDTFYANSLATIQDGANKDAGVQVGNEAAQAILSLRQNDGSGATPPLYTPGHQLGAYQFTPPNFSQPVFTHWSKVTPFVLASGDQYRPKPFPAINSKTYQNSQQQITALGRVDSLVRTAEQTTIARFWGGAVQNFWNEISQTVAVNKNTTLSQNARMFALLNIALADATIALYDAKYTYQLWRPITPIQAIDATWSPLLKTPLDPSYPGAHSVLSAAAAKVLMNVFHGDNVAFTISSEALPGVMRSFASLSDAVNEAGLSRTYAGVHFSIDDSAGQILGKHIGYFVLGNTLKHLP
jgi:PAP2 superfamily